MGSKDIQSSRKNQQQKTAQAANTGHMSSASFLKKNEETSMSLTINEINLGETGNTELINSRRGSHET